MQSEHEISDAHVNTLVEYVRSMIPDAGPPDYTGRNAALVCIEAVLSIRRPYDAFVVPRLQLFARNYPHIMSLQALLHLLDAHTVAEFCSIWQYRHAARVEMLRALVVWFLAYKEKCEISDDLAAMQRWAVDPAQDGPGGMRIHGIGIATRQYLRMLVGADTVKPDRHILNAIRDALGIAVTPDTAILLVQAAARRLGMSASTLDYHIWRAYAAEASKGRSRAAAAHGSH